MGALEEQARFLTAKYGTAAGPTGLPAVTSVTPSLPALMVGLGLLIFIAVLIVLVRDMQSRSSHEHL